MRRICILFNHDQLHQVAHSLPIALHLARMEDAEVTLAFGNGDLEKYIRTLIGPEIERFRIARLDLKSFGSIVLAGALQKLVPARKALLYADNLDFFRGFDALIVSEKTSLLLKTRYGLDALKIIHTRHGAGDRAIGFNRESGQFDLVLVSGAKIARRLEREAGVDPARIRIIGYAKFDLFGENRITSPFPNDRPVVLYAPHPSPRLSSYYAVGRRLIRDIAESGRFNLIFAPHVMLMHRRWVASISPPALARVPHPYPRDLARDNVLFDPGGPACSDMSYTNLADIYVGDVSSQIYEYLLHPRPVLHVNAHGAQWWDDPNFLHWTAGPVIGPDDDIPAALDVAVADFPRYRAAQEALFAATIDVTAEPAGLRGARAVMEYLHENRAKRSPAGRTGGLGDGQGLRPR